jgi:NADH-quinone oxidoreductase subunit A
MNPYIPVLIVLIFGLTLGAILSGLAAFLGPRNPRPEKMSVKFYLTAILFILFDIETIFLYLWAKAFPQLGWFGVSEILVFMVILVAGYIYVVKRGALEWD